MLANIELWLGQTRRDSDGDCTQRAFPGNGNHVNVRHDSERGKTSFVNEIFAQLFTMRYTKCSSMQAIERSQYLLKNKNIKCVQCFSPCALPCIVVSSQTIPARSQSISDFFYSFDRHIHSSLSKSCVKILFLPPSLREKLCSYNALAISTFCYF